MTRRLPLALLFLGSLGCGERHRDHQSDGGLDRAADQVTDSPGEASADAPDAADAPADVAGDGGDAAGDYTPDMADAFIADRPDGMPLSEAGMVCHEYFGALADRFAACLGYDAKAYLNYLDVDGACLTVSRGVADGRIGLVATEKAACLAAIAATPCEQLDSRRLAPDLKCQKLLPGLVPSGGACRQNDRALISDCTPGTRCRPDFACPGTCEPEAGIGDGCASDADCAWGNGCTVGGVCGPLGALDAVCGGSDHPGCAPGLFCDGGTFETTGLCHARSADAACTTDQACAVGTYCLKLDGSQHCQPMRKLGESCAPGMWQCNIHTGYCSDSGVCVPYAKLGDKCGPTVSGELVFCLEGICDETLDFTCQPAIPLGGTCALPSQCGSGSFVDCDFATGKCVEVCTGP